MTPIEDLDKKAFSIKEGLICGREAILVTPVKSDMDIWNADNLTYRSVILDKYSKEVLSLGFNRFFNHSQAPELYPDPLKFNDWVIEHKIDGSLMICDFIESQFNYRTRGTFNYSTLENAEDFRQIRHKYPSALDLIRRNQEWSILFEIVSPNNRIVVHYPEVDFYLIGAMNKKTLRPAPTELLDSWADGYGLKRPKKYSFKEMDELRLQVKHWIGEEGVVVTYNNGLNRVKIKSDDYCFKHKVFSGLSNKKDIARRWIELGRPDYDEFYKYYKDNFDYEVAEAMAQDLRAITELNSIVSDFEKKCREMLDKHPNFSQREIAELIESHWIGWKKSIAFNLTKGEIQDKTWKAIVKQEFINQCPNT